jgi:hypothetical protein
MYRYDAGTGTYRSFADENGNYDAPLPIYDDPTKAPGPVIRVTGENGEGWQAVPTTQDFTGLTFSENDKSKYGQAYKAANGDIRYYDPQTDTIAGTVAAPPTSYDPNSLLTNYQGYKYINTPGNDTYMGATYYLDPQTNKLNLYNETDLNSPFHIAPPRSRGGFDDFMAENGWIAPLAIVGAGLASGALGAGAAGAETGGAYGSMGGASGMGGSMGTGLTTGTGAAGGMTTGAGASGGLLGAGSASGLAATQAAAGLGGSYLTGESGLTVKEALTNANRARSIGNLLNSMGKSIGSGSKGTSGNSAYNAQPLDYSTLIVKNRNPFLFETPGQTKVRAGDYDVSGSAIANALRKNDGSYP